MKTIVVNESKKHIASKELQALVSDICLYFSGRRVRKKKWLKTKKEITLVFLSSTEMKKINKSFRGKNKATDILSFTSEDPISLGELLLCLPVLEKQAQFQRHSLKLEITYMLVHGILHLLGYDHELSKAEEKLMFELQEACFANFVS
jgi:probable rRNA maturation factor